MLPEALRVWELTRPSIAAWVVSGAAGYYLFIRPKWYPTIEHERAQEFTPREVEQWNEKFEKQKGTR